MTAPVVDTVFLERRRRLALHWSVGMLALAVVAFPLGMSMGNRGGETEETIAGAFLMAALVGMVAAPWIVRAWQGFMRRRMVAAAVAHRADIRHIDSEHAARDTDAALSSPAFALGAFGDSGLVEAFASASVEHVLTGVADGVPFAVAALALLDDKHYRVFDGVLASFRLARPRPGLTVVTRDRGMLGNLLARAGGAIEPVTLEDPDFEGVFEVYGDDQVGARVVLTTTMLERLKALDTLGHARGFACAFRGEYLLIAFDGMDWRCPAWRIVRPLDGWLPDYAAWLTGLVDLPLGIVHTLNLITPAGAPPAPVATMPATAPSRVAIETGTAHVFSSSLFRLIGEGGMAAVYIASGALFGGLGLFAASYGATDGFPDALFWYLWGLTAFGLIYGTFAIALGARQLVALVWKWRSPLRTMKR